MHLSSIVIVMIKFEMMTSSWIISLTLLCWELEAKNNHEMEYDSQVLVADSSVILICQGFQCIFHKSLLSFTDGAFLWIKKWQENKLYESSWFVNNYSSDVYKQSQVHDFNASPKFYYSDQGTPMD